MTVEIFFDWFRQFNERTRSARKKFLLLVEKCSVHGREETLPHMENFEAFFLPPYAMFKIQPYDADIIESHKFGYKLYQMDRAIDVFEQK